MDFRRANDIVDRLADALANERHIGGSFIAMEWIGTEARQDIMRALYLALAEQYRASFPLSRMGSTGNDFDQFTGIVGGCLAHVSTRVFPMCELAPLGATDKSSPAYWDAESRLGECALREAQRWESADAFAAWLKQVDPTYDDYLAMVNDHIDRCSIARREADSA